MNISARAPAFSHVTATLNGITTIRSQRAQKLLTEEFDVIQDHHTGPFYLFLVSSEAFGFYLDAISNIFLAFVTLQFMFFTEGKSSIVYNLYFSVSNNPFSKFGSVH